MSIFVTGLAFEGAIADQAKIGILGGSAAAALIGLAVLAKATSKQDQEDEHAATTKVRTINRDLPVSDRVGAPA